MDESIEDMKVLKNNKIFPYTCLQDNEQGLLEYLLGIILFSIFITMKNVEEKRKGYTLLVYKKILFIVCLQRLSAMAQGLV